MHENDAEVAGAKHRIMREVRRAQTAWFAAYGFVRVMHVRRIR